MNQAEIFERAAELIERRGWTQDEYEGPGGQLCFVGALRWVIWGGTSVRWDPDSGPLHDAQRTAMRESIVALGEDPVDFNDTGGRTAEEVIDRLKLIAKDLRNRAVPE